MKNCRNTREVSSFFLFIGIAITAVTLMQPPASAGWVWMKDSGFVGSESADSSGQRVSRFERAQNLFYQGRYERSIDLLDVIREQSGDRDLLVRASFLRARALYESGEYIEAYQSLESYKEDFPNNPYQDRIVRYQLDIGFQLMKGKDSRTLLGLPILPAEGAGERIVRTLLSRFPYKPYSDAYQYRLANIYFKRNTYEPAAEEYKFLLNHYEQSSWLPNARFLAGESYFRTVDELDYDISNLDKARSHFRTYVRQYPDQPNVGKARERLRMITRKQAEKKKRIAEWYVRTDRMSGATFYFKEIMRFHPGTKWADQAYTRLQELNADVEEDLIERVETHSEPVILSERESL
jgi:outer membrane assembly lipoprotein YfiO